MHAKIMAASGANRQQLQQHTVFRLPTNPFSVTEPCCGHASTARAGMPTLLPPSNSQLLPTTKAADQTPTHLHIRLEVHIHLCSQQVRKDLQQLLVCIQEGVEHLQQATTNTWCDVRSTCTLLLLPPSGLQSQALSWHRVCGFCYCCCMRHQN